MDFLFSNMDISAGYVSLTEGKLCFYQPNRIGNNPGMNVYVEAVDFWILVSPISRSGSWLLGVFLVPTHTRNTANKDVYQISQIFMN